MNQRKSNKLSKLDKKIIENLLSHPKDSHKEIAERIGSSASSVWRRIQKLEETNIISKKQFSLNHDKLGFAETFFLMLHLRDSSDQHHEKFRRFVSTCENVVSCELIAGEFEYFLTIVTTGMSEYADIIESLRKKNLVEKMVSLGALKSIKNDPGGLITAL